MRIRDWSSDVCSSDLAASMDSLPGVLTSQCAWRAKTGPSTGSAEMSSAASAEKWQPAVTRTWVGCRSMAVRVRRLPSAFMRHTRSEEHTSELQSLMRNSYAVFCLKKKKTKHN